MCTKVNKKHTGFTLIELVVVVVILGVLSAIALPRFIDLSEDAEASAFTATGSAFRAGVEQVHIAWLIRANGQAIQDFIEIPDPSVGGDLSVNSFGYPADTRGVSLTLNSDNDCLDVWRAVLSASGADVDSSDSSDYQATFSSPLCIYTLVNNPSLNVTYNSQTGDVVINN